MIPRDPVQENIACRISTAKANAGRGGVPVRRLLLRPPSNVPARVGLFLVNADLVDAVAVPVQFWSNQSGNSRSGGPHPKKGREGISAGDFKGNGRCPGWMHGRSPVCSADVPDIRSMCEQSTYTVAVPRG
jgi:hypothetical protein